MDGNEKAHRTVYNKYFYMQKIKLLQLFKCGFFVSVNSRKPSVFFVSGFIYEAAFIINSNVERVCSTPVGLTLKVLQRNWGLFINGSLVCLQMSLCVCVRLTLTISLHPPFSLQSFLPLSFFFKGVGREKDPSRC